MSCDNVKFDAKSVQEKEISLDVQGHRGCRGLMPENTIPAFIKALELGVTTLELDLAVSKDGDLIVSHEPFFNHKISIGPGGQDITADNQLSHNIYKLKNIEIAAYDVGTKVNDKFPDQVKMKVHKPRFSEVILATNQWSDINKKPKPFLNIEIKRKPEYDGQFHPNADDFARLVLAQVDSLDITDRTYIQSFDVGSLQAVKNLNSKIPLVYLIENKQSIEKNMAALGFKPEIYSPKFELISSKVLKYCADHNIKLIPWTVNEVDDMADMLKIGVDGIITDYPDRLIALCARENIAIKH